VSLEKLLANGDVFHRHHPVARLVLRNRVEEKGRVAVIDAPEEPRDVKTQIHLIRVR
jgi:hypothetical protein